MTDEAAIKKFRVLDLFSGIGGFSLGLERTGGFPCQDLSTAGKRRGMGEGTRSGLWSEIVRLIGELRPQYVIVENVAALLSGPSEKRGGWFGRILGDLAECGYDAEWENIPAAAVGAPHRRERVWIVANAKKKHVLHPHCERGWRDKPQNSAGCTSFRGVGLRGMWGTSERFSYGNQPALCRLDEWVSRKVVQSHLAAYGNTVYPAIPEMIGNAILQAELKQ